MEEATDQGAFFCQFVLFALRSAFFYLLYGENFTLRDLNELLNTVTRDHHIIKVL